MTRLDPGAFWEFSLAYYSRERVAAACLSLQNRRGADVNILLFCCWLATMGWKVERDGLHAAIATVEAWRRDVLEPLRGARRTVADQFPELAKSDRQSIKHGMLSVELECERVAQEKIALGATGVVAVEDGSTPLQLASAALETYLDLVVGTPDEQDAEDLKALLEPL
ncbi:TIGR02444 family protein [Dongia sp.]|uniref:TIGR02444 family protein n=1 Tax=Dongia sp. TaxID=1977262 RepID=UPI003750C0AF